jgi:uncharacterized protein (TIRG00374 family)
MSGAALMRVLRIAFAVALIIALFQLVDLRRLWDSADASMIVAALLMQPLIWCGWLLAGWRHALLVGKPQPPVLLATRAYVLSTGLNVLLPLRAGELIKATYLRAHYGTRLRSAIGAILLERLLDAVVIGAIGVAGLSAHVAGAMLWPMILTLAAGFAGIFTVAALPPARIRLLARRVPRRVAQVLHLVEAIARVARSRALVLGAVLSVAAWAANFAAIVTFLSIQSTLGPLTLAEQAALFAVTLFAGALPGLPGGVGAYQAAGALLLSGFGYAVEPALAVLVVLQLSSLAVAVGFAGVEMTLRSTGVGSLLGAVRGRDRAGPPSGSKQIVL